MPGAKVAREDARLAYVARIRSRGTDFFYYRRDGKRHPLAGPENSPAFLADYKKAHAEFERDAADAGRHTVGAAIREYRAGADHARLASASTRHYELYLGELETRAGDVLLVDVTADWVDGLRDRLADDPHRWNRIRSLMRQVTAAYLRRHPEAATENPWFGSKRIKVANSTQNRPWPDAVLIAVLRDATPAFRALITCLLLSAQRIGDVCSWPDEAYDPETRILKFTQGKTGTPMALKVPPFMADALAGTRGQVPGRLLATARGRAWTKVNAEEILLGMRARLGLERYTLHGLRGTGASALVMLGFSLEQVIAMTGHTDIRALRPYLQGVENMALAAPLQAALEERYGEVLSVGAENTRSYSGVTGKAARKAGVVGQSRRRKREAEQTEV